MLLFNFFLYDVFYYFFTTQIFFVSVTIDTIHKGVCVYINILFYDYRLFSKSKKKNKKTFLFVFFLKICSIDDDDDEQKKFFL